VIGRNVQVTETGTSGLERKVEENRVSEGDLSGFSWGKNESKKKRGIPQAPEPWENQ